MRGSALVVTLVMVLVLSIAAGAVVQSLLPRMSTAATMTGWQESLIAAEAGLDIALADLYEYVPDITTGAWTGWKKKSGGNSSGEPASGADLLPPSTTSFSTSTISGATGLAFSSEIVRDNIVVSADGANAMVDVVLTALYPDYRDRNNVWIRIRAMSTASVTARATPGIDAMDARLRKIGLVTRRLSLDGDVNLLHSVPTPNASRTIEVLLRPVFPFENAITTEGYLELPNSNNFLVDSFDSTDPNKSNNGLYAEIKRQRNGDLASNGKGIDAAGTQVSVNGRPVYGDVKSNGGNADAITGEENVYGEVGHDFSADLKIVRPPAVLPNLQPSNSTLEAGINGETNSYEMVGDVGGLTITGPSGVSGSNPGRIIIVINGNLDVSSTISVPPNVKAHVYVSGNIQFNNKDINATSSDNRLATHLLIFGTGEEGNLGSHGNPNVYAAVYAPTYNAEIKGGGNGSWYGSLVAKNVAFNGGGDSSYHYDEALLQEGPITRFVVSKYFEDVRR